jgi:hypothetical protein
MKARINLRPDDKDISPVARELPHHIHVPSLPFFWSDRTDLPKKAPASREGHTSERADCNTQKFV